jgi:hypothetical protein
VAAVEVATAVEVAEAAMVAVEVATVATGVATVAVEKMVGKTEVRVDTA